jgi:hypothetical protein
MTKQENIDNPNSCWNKAADDEPIFILKASDQLAPALVEEWANRYAQLKTQNVNSMTPEQARKYEEALQVAMSMEAWRDQK